MLELGFLFGISRRRLQKRLGDLGHGVAEMSYGLHS